MTFDFSLHPHFFFFADPVEYNCSNRTDLEWENEKDSSVFVGWWFITLGLASFSVYAVLLLAMSSKETLQNGCLQLIYFNCWIDCGSIACGGLITGWLFIRGDVYCTNTFWTFTPGAVGLGCWSSSCVLCIALAFSRICALHGYEWKYINYMVMGISTVYGLFMMVLTRPVVFNAPRGSWFFSPYIQEAKQFANSYHLTENVLVTILTPLLYVYVCLRLFLHPAYRTNVSSANRHLQISACLQSFLICLLVCIAAVLFAYMQIFDYPPWLPLTAEIAYQICGTLPAAVLLVVNKNIRRRAIWLILRKGSPPASQNFSKRPPQKVPASAVLETIFKDYDPQVRPPNKHRNGSNKAIEVQVDTYIRSLSSIDFVKMEYSVQLTFRQSWIDRRLAYHHLGQRVPKFIILTRANQLWIPDTFFMNEKNAHKHLVDVPNILFRVHPDGRILYSERISLILSCPMFLQRFPMDRQMCEMKLASYAFTTDDIQYRWKYHDPLQFNVVLNWSIPNFELDNAYVGTCDSLTNTGLYSCLVATFHFSRQFSYYLVQIYVPSTLLVVVSWVSFWLERTAVPARVTLGVTTLLTITTQTTSLNAQLPAVSYVKAVDIWMGGCLVFIFGAVFEYAYVSLVASNLEITKKKYKTEGISDEKTNGKIDEEQTTAQDRANRKSLCGWWKHWTFQADESKMIDLYSRIFFPFGFLLFNIFYWFWYMGL